MSERDNAFFNRADAFIALANEQMEKVSFRRKKLYCRLFSRHYGFPVIASIVHRTIFFVHLYERSC